LKCCAKYPSDMPFARGGGPAQSGTKNKAPAGAFFTPSSKVIAQFFMR
jgi:hypothetical protein